MTKQTLENFEEQAVKGAGEYFTKEVILQHQKHFLQETFEVTPMESGVDIFLPFWWITKHTLQGMWTSVEVRFNSPSCLEKCTKFKTANFELSWDEEVCQNLNARVIGYVSVAKTEDSLKLVPAKFHQYLDVMGKELAEVLPAHNAYNCKIDLKEGSMAPWEPIYPLSEIELQVLWEWLKEMEKTGKICRSTSPAGSPILFVPKPNGRDLKLYVDYRALNQITISNRYPLSLIQEL